MTINYSQFFDNTHPRLGANLGLSKRLYNKVAAGLEGAWNSPLELMSASVSSSAYASPADLLSVSFPQFNDSLVPQKALIMAAGEGTRLRPLTAQTPKPLVEVAGKPIIEYTLDLMTAAGVRNHLINVGYLAEQIKTYATFKQSRSLARNNYLTVQQDALVKSAALWRTVFSGPFFYSNADSIIVPSSPKTEANPFIRLSLEWARTQSDVTLLVYDRNRATDKSVQGDYDIKGGQVVWGNPEADNPQYVWTGMALATPRFTRQLVKTWAQSQLIKTEGGSVDRKDAHSLLGRMADPDTKALPRFSAVIHDGPFFDISTPAMRDEAEAAVRQMQAELSPL
jgi:MurNAc alpha-1-phosphate uridylyltransferase